VLLVVLWLPSYFIFRDLNTWQLVINTATTIVTFLLVALLQNSQRRSDQALQAKLDAIADGVADLMVAHEQALGGSMRADIAELREVVGLEDGE
jgi:low affinity Fe/Cu permease